MIPQQNYTSVTLGSCIDMVKGYAFKSKWYTDVGVPIVKVSNFTVDSVDISNLVCIPDEIAQNYTKHELRPKDVVIQTVGSWPSQPESVVGKVIKIPLQFSGSLLNQNAVKIIPRSHLDKGYLFYMLRDNDFKGYIVATAQGAASQASITLASIRNYTFHLPLFPIQRKIAAALSAYDDLIENNTRRIKILEEMASTIYREWFVEFRFPGHEGVEMVESVLGLIPQGWEVVKISDIVDLSRKGIIPSKFPQEIFAHFSIPAFDNGCMPAFDSGNTIKSNKYLVTENCVLVSKLNPNIPRVWFPFLDSIHHAVASTEFLILTPNPPVDCVFLFNLCRSTEFSGKLAVRALGTSRSHQRVSPTDFLSLLVLIPTKSLLNAFHERVSPMIHICNTLRLKNTNLRQARDLLLPRLISGKIDVSELDIDVLAGN